MPAPCRPETAKYRACLREKRSSGRNCDYLAKKLEACRTKWRKENRIAIQFDGTRVLPNEKCRALNETVQNCLKWRQGQQEKCRDEIEALNECMLKTKGKIVPPTSTDKIWETK